MNRLITRELLVHLKEQFVLDWHGIHGVRHWARVRRNGLMLARHTGANTRVIELFAFLHDSRRQHDGHDLDHGYRAAEFAQRLHGRYFALQPAELDLLVEACSGHSEGGTQAGRTVATCWDADRLDLGRVGIRPHPEFLCTETARQPQVIEACYLRSLDGTTI
ncbi:MAG: hypothetical protein FJ189_00920 [Gammaproteobacteria bacterium]|nr:hypothetical protein [Gammaproteobacteria bacterium]